MAIIIDGSKKTNQWGINTHPSVPVGIRDELVSLLVYEVARSIAEPSGGGQYNPALVSRGYYDLVAAVADYGLTGATSLPSDTAMEADVLGKLIIATLHPYEVAAIPQVVIGEVTCELLKRQYAWAYPGVKEASQILQEYIRQFKKTLGGVAETYRETEILALPAPDALGTATTGVVPGFVADFHRDSDARRAAIIAEHARIAEKAKADMDAALAAVNDVTEEPMVAPAPMVMPAPPSIRQADEGWDAGDIALGILGVAAVGAAVYYGHKYMSGTALDDVVLLDLDTTL